VGMLPQAARVSAADIAAEVIFKECDFIVRRSIRSSQIGEARLPMAGRSSIDPRTQEGGMTRWNRGSGLTAFVIGILVLGVAIGGGILLKRAHAQSADVDASDTEAARLLADIREYRANASTMEPEIAVRQWFALFERAGAPAGDFSGADVDAFDTVVPGMVSQQSLLAALPAPTAWPAFRAELERRVAQQAEPKMLALRYLAELLDGDRTAALATLGQLENKDNANAVRAARALLARLYGDAAAQVAAFEIELNVRAEDYDALEIPDLLALAGPRRAEELLSRAMSSSRTLSVSAGDSMRALARRVALANVPRMARPQWGLADSVDAAALYEALDKRFPRRADDQHQSMDEWRWRNATTYYFLAMVQRGRHADAERALGVLHGRNEYVSIPREAVDALQRARLNEPLYRFLDGLLTRRPDAPAWNLYFEQAALTGHSELALARIDQILGRKDLSPSLRAELQSRRFVSLLAADRLDQAEALAVSLLTPAPTTRDPALSTRVDVATRALDAGRLLGRDVLAQSGLGFLRAVVALPDDDLTSSLVTEARSTLYRQLRRMGRSDEALAMARATADQKPTSFSEAFARRMGEDVGPGGEATLESAGIHSAAGRHDEVLDLLHNSPRWGAADLADVLADVDSQGMSAGVIAARALAAQGDTANALHVARATVAAAPGKDAGYQLIAELDPNAIDSFNEMFADDEFEERPLIWKASLQLASGAIDAAEQTIRRAIAVDPSDGEEGPGDRMRAYAVLSDILRKKGDAGNATLYSNAVEAIRISETGDQLHGAGLYDRAFRTYREALEKFSDAYCIQSRLAVQLNKQGRRKEALEHYRRAYELMPDSFGRVESHCFGCENVFQGEESQSLAERIFTDIIRKSPGKPQAHYLLAYLREQQGRYEEAMQPLRAAVSLDDHYLNAWKRLDDIADRTFIEAAERDIARIKLLELDPLRRHAHYDLTEVGDLRGLWNGAERARALHAKVAPPSAGLYRLEASARLREETRVQSGEESSEWFDMMQRHASAKGPSATLYEHVLVSNAVDLMGIVEPVYE
jgi:tetratricopeptide (TPR) repeat protein